MHPNSTTNFGSQPSTVEKIWALLSSAERRRAIFVLILMFIGMLLETLGVGLVIPVIALMTQNDLGANYPALQPLLNTLGNPDQKSLIIGGMLVLIGVYLVKAIFLAYLAWRQTRLAFSVQAQLSRRLFTIYLQQPYTFHLQRNSAQLIRNILTEVKLFASNGITACLEFLTEGLVLLGLCTLLLVIEPVGALIVVMVLGSAAMIFHRVTRRYIIHWGIARQHHEGLRIQHLQQGLGGAKDVILLGREDDFLDQFQIHNAQSARVGQLQRTLQQLPRLWLELLAVMGLATLVLVMLAQNSEMGAIMPTLGLFAVAAFRLLPSVNRILAAAQLIRFGLPVIDTLYEEFKLATPVRQSERLQKNPFKQSIRLEHVSYTYDGANKSSLADISLRIDRGESVGFIGTSGAGKSTLVDIILGLLTPNEGFATVDGEDIQNNLRNWQDQIGYVPQSIFLTDDSLRRNVAFGLPNEEINEQAVRSAVKAAQLEEFVDTLPQGLDTLVGERGIRLSGGQRQRIGIARALYHDPSALVLDEATSSLDTATEHDVMQAVTALQGEKTILIVAHRLSTVERCDRVYRLEQGKLVGEEDSWDSIVGK